LGIAADRKHTAKCLFPQEKGTLHTSQNVYIYSQNALDAAEALKGIGTSWAANPLDLSLQCLPQVTIEA
jgi:hypothetical protein